MATSYEDVIEKFYRKIKQDKDYFCINDLTEYEFNQLLNERSVELLDDAVNELQLLVSVNQDVDFQKRDEIMEEWKFNLTAIEQDLISDLMVVKYFDEELIKLKAMQKYLGSDINVFSPAHERKTYLQMVEYKHKTFESKLSKYNTRDRLTGKHLLAY